MSAPEPRCVNCGTREDVALRSYDLERPNHGTRGGSVNQIPHVYWCARTGELATDYTAGMVYLDEHHRPPDDAVRLVPEHPGVAALLRRCDDVEADSPNRRLTRRLISIDEVRALLGGADNNNEGER